MGELVRNVLAGFAVIGIFAVVALAGLAKREAAVARRIEARMAEANRDMATNPTLIRAQFDAIVARSYRPYDHEIDG